MRAEVSDQLLTLTLDRPERRNALDPEMRDELAAALDDAARSASISAVVITGAGGAFCAGGDLARVRGPSRCARSTATSAIS